MGGFDTIAVVSGRRSFATGNRPEISIKEVGSDGKVRNL